MNQGIFLYRLRWIRLAAALAALAAVPVLAAPAPQVSAQSSAAPASNQTAAPAAAASNAIPLPPTNPDAQPLYQRVVRLDPPSANTAGAPFGLNRAVGAFYAQRHYALAWSDTTNVQQLLDNLRALDQDGLNPADFRTTLITDTWNGMVAKSPTPEQRANFDVLASSAYISALVELSRGRLDPDSLGPNRNFDLSAIDPQQGLNKLVEAVDQHRVDALFAQVRPQNPLYADLRQTLAKLRQLAATAGWPSVADGPPLKPGMDDPRVISLRRRLVAENYLAADHRGGSRYDDAVKLAVQHFQRDQYLQPDGNLGPGTLAVLNTPISARIDQVRVNLERARWLLRQDQGTFVVVDIAGYKIAYYRDGKAIWRSRVQVGKPFRSTPIFKSQITYVTFNPTWTVPPTILRNDILPKVRKDPGYLAANRIRALDADGQTVDPHSIDWTNPRGITLRQDAGPGNSLGQVAIRFPNPFSVYLHDTPHRDLFDRERRDTSSGCIRVEHPLDLVQLLFNDTAQWNQDTIGQRIATGKTQNVKLPSPVPILLAYWTVDVADDGRVTFKPDVYGRDAQVLAALNKPQLLPLL